MMKTNRLLIAGLVALLMWAHLATLGTIPNGQANLENRRLVSWPDWPNSREGLVGWPRKIETFFADRMSHRQHMIALNSWVRAKLLRSSTNSSVLRGKDGWLFHFPQKNPIVSAGRSEYPPGHLRRIRITLEERRDWLAQRGTDFVVGITPTKQSVYPEMLPAHIGPLPAAGRRNQLLKHLKKNSPDLKVVDFTPELIARKQRDQVFYATDTHWNYLGALIGYRKMLSLVPDIVPTDQLLKERDMVTKPKSRHTNLNKMLGLADEEVSMRYLPQGRWAFKESPLDRPQLKMIAKQGVAIVYTIDRDDLPSAYLLADSFAKWNIYYISQHFKRTVLTNTWGSQWTHHDHFPADLIELENPDVVFLQLVEDRLKVRAGGAYLVNIKGSVNVPHVRQARLTRLFGQAKSTRAQINPGSTRHEKTRKGTHEVVTFPLPDQAAAQFWIAKIELDPHRSGLIEIWDRKQQSKIVKIDEVARYKFNKTDRVIYLCVPGRMREAQLRLTPADAAEVRSIDLVPHHDL